MVRRVLRSPMGVAGVLIFVFGVLLGLRYDPRRYELEETRWITGQQRRVRAMVENEQKKQDRDTELAMIFGSMGFGLLMLGSAAWRVRHSEGEGPAGQ